MWVYILVLNYPTPILSSAFIFALICIYLKPLALIFSFSVLIFLFLLPLSKFSFSDLCRYASSPPYLFQILVQKIWHPFPLYLDFHYFTFLIIKFKLRIGKLLSFPYVLSLILHLNPFSYVSSCFHPLTFLPRFYMERAGQFCRRPSACLTKKVKDMTPCCRSSTRTGAGCVAPKR